MKKIIVSAILILMFSLSLLSEFSHKVSGYYKGFFSVLYSPDKIREIFNGFEETSGIFNNNIRLKAVINFNSSLSFETAYSLSPLLKTPVLFSEAAIMFSKDNSSYRISDLREYIYPSEINDDTSFAICQNFDRAFLTIQTENVDIFIGRQPIAWGSARVINPTDIISPFSFTELDKEERRGVDAVRLRFSIGDMSEIDAGIVFNKNFKMNNNAVFLRIKTELSDKDISLILLKYYSNLLIGGDVSGSIGGAGFWFEAAYSFLSVFDEEDIINNTEKANNYLRFSVGLEYSFSDKFYAFSEYHYNSSGYKDPNNYLIKISSKEFIEGSILFGGKHYLSLGFNYTLTPLLPFSSILIYNLSDSSFILSNTLEYNIAENIYIGIGGYISIGKEPKFFYNENNYSVTAGSEFGISPTILYSSFKVYF